MIATLVSGGKDSTATLVLAIKELGRDKVVPVFTDTGFEHPLTYEYLDYLEEKLHIKIHRVRNNEFKDLPSLILEQKRFPSTMYRFCTHYLKRVPAARFLADHPEIREVWIGIRAKESRRRQKRYGELTKDDTIPYVEIGSGLPAELRKAIKHVQARFPIVNWTEEEVFEFLKENDIKPNPLYQRGHTRVGCFPCLLSGFNEFRLCWKDKEGKKNILKLEEIESFLRSQGYPAKFRDHMTVKDLIKKLEFNEAQLDMFCDGGACSFCNM